MENVFSGKRAVLFDLDGVVVDSESQYTQFWQGLCGEYFPQDPELGQRIKGMTLDQIFSTYFPDKSIQESINKRVSDFEATMNYEYIQGFPSFISELHLLHFRTAVVTSSNLDKMDKLYRKHPEFRRLFDRILTSEDFTRSKPAPDCYLQAAESLAIAPADCVGIEDSFNGLKSLRAARITTIAFATTNPASAVAPYADLVASNYDELLPQLRQCEPAAE
jgi:beta-phosphoglucomutase